MKNRSSRRVRQTEAPLPQGLLQLDGVAGSSPLEYRLRRSDRARYMRLLITREREIVLTLPRHCSLDEGVRFIRTKAEWIRRHLAKLPVQESLLDFLEENPRVSVLGCEVPVERGRSFGYARIEWDAGRKPWKLWVDPARHGEDELVPLFRAAASDILARHTRLLRDRLALPVKRVSVRDQSSLWGSCSGRGTISLNWRLLLLPPALQEYVILHELAHLTEMNHSERFWNVLKSYDPRAIEHDRLLTRISSRYMALGRVKKGTRHGG